MECDRVNASAPCLPMMPIRIAFSAQVPVANAREIILTDSSGRQYAPSGLDDLGDAAARGLGVGGPSPKRSNIAVKVGDKVLVDATPSPPLTEGLSFAGPFPERGKLSLRLGAKLVDDVGRRPANLDRFPLAIPLDDYPPLIKFSGEFGILEATTGGVLPVTLRNVERPVSGRRAGMAPNRGIPGESKRIDRDADIAEWMRRVETAAEWHGEWERSDRENEPAHWRELTGSTSVFADDEATEPFTVPRLTSERGFEVVGIPLKQTGFYVVELASPRLGAALLGVPRPRFVSTAALVTNLSVHFKWGRESSRVWVTALDTGRPVRGAAIRISGWCTGDELWNGVTDADGIAGINETLGDPHANEGCHSWTPQPLMVSARLDGDMSFTVSAWQRGIEPNDFRMPAGWGGEAATYTARTVFDRTLLRAGETVSMKHFFRQRVSSGLRIPAETRWPTKLVLQHEGSGQRYDLPIRFDASGVAESSWVIPADAKLGSYRVSLEGAPDSRAYGSGEFRVEQYRVPTMKAVVQAPAAPVIDARSVSLDLFVGYLSGGAAAGAPVRLRTLVEPRTPSFRDYADFQFGGGDVKEGIAEADGEDLLTWLHGLRFGAYAANNEHGEAATVQPITLDENGAARATVALPKIDASKSLIAELEYADANGELLTASTRVPLWPAAVSLGIRVEGWAGTREELKFKVAAVDPGGKALAGRSIQVDLFERRNYSYRKRLIGGFYAYENKVDVRRLEAECSGRTNAHGLLDCKVEPGISGEVVIRARAEDDGGHTALASTTGVGRRRRGLVVRAWQRGPHGRTARAERIRTWRQGAVPGAHAVPFGDRARDGRARGRDRQLRDATVGARARHRGAGQGRLCAEYLCLRAGGARTRLRLAGVAR
jgi:hypothetical protein